MADEQRRGRRGGVETSLRTSAVWASVHDLATRRERELGRPLRVLDLGGGTGGLAVPLAERGHHVTAVQGDADTLADILGGDLVDLVCCHGTLEVVDDPQATLASLAAVLTPDGYLSLVAAQRLAVVLARVLAGQFAQAREALVSVDGRWGPGDPLPRRFDAHALTEMVTAAGFTVRDSHGVRLFSDLVPSALVDSEADRLALLQLEQEASRHPDFGFLGQLGASLHILASRG